MIAAETNEGFPSEIKGRKMSLTIHALPSLLLHQWMSSCIIRHSFIVLLLCQCTNSLVYREKIYLPPPASISLSPSLFLCFSSFIYLNVNYICVGYLHLGVLMYSVLVFLVCVSGSWSVSVLFGVFLFCSWKSKLKDVKVPVFLVISTSL